MYSEGACLDGADIKSIKGEGDNSCFGMFSLLLEELKVVVGMGNVLSWLVCLNTWPPDVDIVSGACRTVTD